LAAPIGIATSASAALLLPRPVLALDFSFSYGDQNGQSVEGIIRQIADDATSKPASIEVTRSPVGTPYFPAARWVSGDGFTVSNQQITGYRWKGQASTQDWCLSFDSAGVRPGAQPPLVAMSPSFPFSQVGPCSSPTLTSFGTNPAFTLLSTPALPGQSAPGPLPVLGAAAAFAYSRKLRSRLKA
jgi:hypothetical protein